MKFGYEPLDEDHILKNILLNALGARARFNCIEGDLEDERDEDERFLCETFYKAVDRRCRTRR